MEKNFQIVRDGGVTSALGFKAAGVCAGLKKSRKADMAMIFSESPASFAGAFTTCLFAAAPVQVCKSRVEKERSVRAVIINSGNANACTGDEGVEAAEAMCAETAAALGVSPREVMVASTGRIGVPLPMTKISKAIKAASDALSRDGGAEAARAIMTTDTRPKEIAVKINVGGSEVTIGGMVKGAGMIAPRLKTLHATMLCFITTDADVDNRLLSQFLEECSELSFNRVTVDGDTSTNDTVVIMANGASGKRIERRTPDAELFKKALLIVMEHLAKEMVRDGEGMTKVVSVEVVNARSDEDARLCAETVANSLLCKTAWFGCDPNWGRVLAAAGRSGARFDPSKVSLDYDDMPVVRNGKDAGTPEADLAKLMKKPEFTVKIDLNCGKSSIVIWTNDLSYDYVKINADYHT